MQAFSVCSIFFWTSMKTVLGSMTKKLYCVQRLCQPGVFLFVTQGFKPQEVFAHVYIFTINIKLTELIIQHNHLTLRNNLESAQLCISEWVTNFSFCLLCYLHQQPCWHVCINWEGAGVFVKCRRDPQECSYEHSSSSWKQCFSQVTVNSVIFHV